jgi:hypothetical protein
VKVESPVLQLATCGFNQPKKNDTRMSQNSQWATDPYCNAKYPQE